MSEASILFGCSLQTLGKWRKICYETPKPSSTGMPASIEQWERALLLLKQKRRCGCWGMLLHHMLLQRDSTWGASQGPVCLRARGDAQQFPMGRLLTALLTSAGLLNEAEFLHKQQREASLPNFSQMLWVAPGRGTPPAPGLARVGACGQTANVCPQDWASPCTQLPAGTETWKNPND